MNGEPPQARNERFRAIVRNDYLFAVACWHSKVETSDRKVPMSYHRPSRTVYKIWWFFNELFESRTALRMSQRFKLVKRVWYSQQIFSNVEKYWLLFLSLWKGKLSNIWRITNFRDVTFLLYFSKVKSVFFWKILIEHRPFCFLNYALRIHHR